MTTTPRETLRYIESERLRLIAATRHVINQDLAGHEALADALQVTVPGNWPPELYDHQAMAYSLRQLKDPAEQGWSFWYLINRQPAPEELVGICGFKGRPDQAGSVEIGYSVLYQFRSAGLASEAVATLVNWAFTHGRVKEVCAETLPHLRQSIRVLEKNGFAFEGPGSERGVVRYTLPRSGLN